MPGDAFADLAAQAEIVGQVERDEGPWLETELDLGQVGADVLRRARAFEVDRRSEAEPARLDDGEAEALIGRFERERLVAALAVYVDIRADVEFIGPGIVGIGLRANRDAIAVGLGFLGDGR
jgi:hypothetical protein